MSGWYALDVDARESIVVVDIDDNDEQDAFWHMKPTLDIKKKEKHRKPFYFKFLSHIMTITSGEIEISRKLNFYWAII